MDTLWPSVLDALIDVVEEAVGTVQVFDGPPVTFEDLPSYVVVGADPSGETGAGQWTDVVTTVGLPARHEEYGSINGTVVAQTGDTTISSSRATAFTLFEAIVDQIETDPCLGMSNLVAGRIESGSVNVGQSPVGSFTEVSWVFEYKGVTGT